MEDSSIVDLYLLRDEAAISETARKYGPKLRALADRILHDLPAAEECENDAYLQAWRSIPPHEPRTYLFPFLGRIVRHLAIDESRRRSIDKRSAEFCELTGELAECLHLDYGTLTPVLKRLDQAGYLTRTRAADDERLLKVSLTDEGRELKKKAAGRDSNE